MCYICFSHFCFVYGIFPPRKKYLHFYLAKFIGVLFWKSGIIPCLGKTPCKEGLSTIRSHPVFSSSIFMALCFMVKSWLPGVCVYLATPVPFTEFSSDSWGEGWPDLQGDESRALGRGGLGWWGSLHMPQGTAVSSALSPHWGDSSDPSPESLPSRIKH